MAQPEPAIASKPADSNAYAREVRLTVRQLTQLGRLSGLTGEALAGYVGRHVFDLTGFDLRVEAAPTGLRQQLEHHARAIFALLCDSAPVGLNRVKNAMLMDRDNISFVATGYADGEYQHGDVIAAFTPDYRWQIEGGGLPGRDTAKAIEVRKRGNE